MRYIKKAIFIIYLLHGHENGPVVNIELGISKDINDEACVEHQKKN